MNAVAQLADPAARIVEATWRLILDDAGRDPSVRRIAAAAAVNQAMICYYFDSKEGLLGKMFLTHAKPLMQRRVEGLSRLKGGDLNIEKVLEAWLSVEFDPLDGRRFAALSQMLSLHHASLYKRLFSEATEGGARHFVDALCSLLPTLSREAVVCRFHAVANAVAASDDPFAIDSMNALDGRGTPIDRHNYMAELLSFAIAGFRARPAPAKGNAERARR